MDIANMQNTHQISNMKNFWSMNTLYNGNRCNTYQANIELIIVVQVCGGNYIEKQF